MKVSIAYVKLKIETIKNELDFVVKKLDCSEGIQDFDTANEYIDDNIRRLQALKEKINS